jgi:hypothetical protein
VAAILADVHLHSQDYQKTAAAEFEAVLKINADHAALTKEDWATTT